MISGKYQFFFGSSTILIRPSINHGGEGGFTGTVAVFNRKIVFRSIGKSLIISPGDCGRDGFRPRALVAVMGNPAQEIMRLHAAVFALVFLLR